MTDVLLVADTHLGPGAAVRLVDRIAAELARADVVLHAGDITDRSVLDALGARHVVHAVLGNNDHGIDLPERALVDIDGCLFAMVHDSGAANGRTARLRRWFPDADVVMFGHSHLPWHETDARASDGHVQHHVNPGSAMQRRRAPACTVAHVLVEHGRVTAVDHVAVGPQ
jgi:putative phosphoesterase